MINTDVSICTSFVTLGALEHNSNKVYEAWDQGAYELHSVFAQIGQMLSKMCEVVVTKGDYDFPGVFDYEVSEPLGAWLGKRLIDGWTFSSEEVYRYAVECVTEFFYKAEDLGVQYNRGRLAGLIEATLPVPEITW